MRIRLSVDDPRTNQLQDVGIECTPDHPVGDVLALLEKALGVRSSPTVAGISLDPAQAVGNSPLRDGIVLDYAGRSDSGTRPSSPRLRVISGPDSGATVDLVPNRQMTVGRGPTAALALTDTDVSRIHLGVTLSGDRVALVDLKSRNGTRFSRDGSFANAAKLTPGEPHVLADGEQVQVGGTRMRVESPSRMAAAIRADPEGGRFLVNRAPRHGTEWTPPTVQFPSQPTELEEPRMSIVLAIVLPLALSLAFVVFTRQLIFLMFAVLSPVSAFATWWSTRRASRKRREHRETEHRRAVVSAQQAAHAAIDDEDAHLRRQWPDPESVVRIGTDLTTGLWQRRGTDRDWLRLRLGTAPRSPSFHRTGAIPRDWTIPTILAAPYGVDLGPAGAVGIAGRTSELLDYLNWTLIQAAVLHGPDDLRIAVLAPGRQELAWARWLPHVSPPGSALLAAWDDPAVPALVEHLAESVRARQDTSPFRMSHQQVVPHTLVVLAGSGRLTTRPDVINLIEQGIPTGLRFVCADEHHSLLPSACAAVLDLNGAMTRLRIRGADEVTVRPDGLPREVAERVARRLAPLRVVGGQGGAAIPDMVRMADLVPDRDTNAIGAGWRLSSDSTSVPIGMDAAGPVSIDLVEHGPHCLVVGTSGSGKSEFLVTLLAGLAMANTPERLNFLFVDYKGGATFKDLRRLPHCVGLVTNISGSPARVLSSLHAELTRRQKLYDQAGANSLGDYCRRRTEQPTLPPMSRLVVVVDEFAELNRTMSDAVDQLVGIALTGRALGVHLILATQTSTGITDTIKKNVALGVCLKTSRSDSDTVLDSPVAAQIGKFQKGRAFLRRGDELREVQTAWAGAPAGGERVLPARAVPLRWNDLELPDPKKYQPNGLRTDLDELIDAIIAAADADNVRPPHHPWHDPLPARVDLDALHTPAHHLVLGLRDQPSAQMQEPLAIPLGTGHLLLVGGAQSGRTFALRAIAVALGRGAAPEQVHIHVVDGGRALAGLAELPHCGVVTTTDQIWRVRRLLDRLSDLIDERRAELSTVGSASVNELWAGDPVNAPPHVVLLVDGVDTLMDNDPLWQRFLRILQDGQACGISVCLAARETSVRGTLISQFAYKLCLRLPDDAKKSLLDIDRKVDITSLSPGRAIWTADGSEVQLPVLASAASGIAQGQALRKEAERLRAHWPARGGRRPMRIDALPSAISLADALALSERPASGFAALLGVAGDHLAGQWIDVRTAGGLLTVAGPRRSGRTTAVCTMAISLAQQGRRVLLVRARESTVYSEAVAAGVEQVGPTDLAAELDRGADVVVVDDFDVVRLADGDLQRLVNPDGPALIASADLTKLIPFAQATVQALARATVGLVLSPQRGELLGVSFGRDHTFAGPAGRGYLVIDGDVLHGQMPIP